jgi:hypothetical protein
MQPKLKGISGAVDSCSGMIVQQAYRAHNKLSAEHKRWVDPEDLMQEALLEAVQAEKRYKPNRGAKYSTYLHTGLFFELSKNYTDKLRQQKRTSVSIVELDAPLNDSTDSTFQVPDKCILSDSVLTNQRRAVYGVVQLCRAVSAGARLVLVKILLCGKRLDEGDELFAPELAEAASRVGAKFADFELLAEDEEIRKMALNQLVNDGIVGLTDEVDTKLLECVGCGGRFSLRDVREGRYFITSMRCRVCYRDLKRDQTSCFGKTKTSKQEGYSEADVECRLHCRDKAACVQFQRKRDSMSKAVDEVVEVEEDELAGVDFEEKPAKKATKTSKPAKAAKATKKSAKAEKSDEKPVTGAAAEFWTKYDEVEAPKEVGGEWPWRAGSLMNRMFQHAYHGVKREELEAQFTKLGRDAKMFIRLLRSGQSGKGAITHTWKLNEEGGKIRPYDVKFHGKEGKAKEAKPKAAKKATKAVAKTAAKKKAA